MKKTILFLALILFTTFGYSQEVQPTTKSYDTNLVGCWKGSEVGQQQKGTSKYWVSCRFADGKSVLLFVAIDKKGNVTQETENGSWWTENGKFFELHDYDGVVDSYNYRITVEGVDFQSIELMGKKDNSYKFTDFKIEDDFIAPIQQD
jgi:hypothetical protein